MAERKPSDDKAAFGVFPQLKRNRSKQDREAAKNVPVDLARGFVSGVAGAPGDIESFLRIPYDYLRAPTMSELVTGDKTSKTYLPTSEDIEKRLPFRSETPVSKAASGLGALGGGFYMGPGSPLKVIGALPAAIRHGAEEFAKASVAGVPHVVKPKGGNWLGGSDKLRTPESDLGKLKTLAGSRKREAELLAEVEEATKMGDQGYLNAAMGDLQRVRGYRAVNDWIDSNLTNYVKKQMATPEDPVRKLAEEGVTHMPLQNMAERDSYVRFQREAEGFPAEGMGQSELAKMWENMADDSIRITKAGDVQEAMAVAPKVDKAMDDLKAYQEKLNQDFIKFMAGQVNKGFSQKEIETLSKMPAYQKAEILGDTKLEELTNNWANLTAKAKGFEQAAGAENPFIAKLDPETRLYSGGTYDLGFDHVVDVLREDVIAGRIRPEQLNKVSMEQAVRRTYEYDQEMAKKMAETRARVTEGMPLYKEYPEGYKWIELAQPKDLPAGYSVVKDDMTGSFKVVDANGKESVTRPANDMGHINVPFNKTEDEAIAEALKYDKRLEEALKYEGEAMGHCVGGYCPDVQSGRSKIYSLRDAKGEPHVTVEASPSEITPFDLPKDIYEEYRRHAAIGIPAHGGRPGATEWVKHFYPDVAEKIIPPDRIVQIKGKGNAKPKDDYLPFVQDFVKGGKWSDVGDFKNTGLMRADDVRKAGWDMTGIDSPYLTKQEYDDLLLNELNKPKGMKAGGKVSISNNPDAMMLAVNNKKLAEGGAVANFNTIPDMNDGGIINQGAPFKKGGKVNISNNKDAMWLATQDQKFVKGGAAKLIGEGLDLITGAKKAATPARELTAEEKLVLEKWGQKQAQEAERAKKVEKMAKDSAKKSPEDSVKPAKASTGKRTATPPDFYRKMAETQGDEAVLRAARAGKHLKPDTSGGYVGAPRTVDSPQALGKMRRDLDQDFIDSVDAVRLADPERLGTWYDRAKSGMAQMTEPYQLPRTLEQHGVYSAGVAPESELTFALKHLNSRVYGDPKMAYRGAGMRTLDRAVAADEPAEMGFKIGEYADKNDPRLPNTGLFGVNDFRRAQGMGYTDPQGNPWKAGVSDTMHPFMDLETALQVDRANKATTGGRSDWYGPHIQELPWVYGKGQDLYSRGSSKTGRYGGDPLEGIKLALQDANKTAIDYAYKHAGSATHEAIPGASTGHVPSMIDAPLSERIAYGNEGRWDRPVPEAALSEFPEVGAGNRDAIYSALGYRQLPTIEASGAYLPEGASAYEMQPVKIARPLLDFPTGGEGLIAPETKQLMDFSERFRALNDAQEAFGYNLPNTMGDVTGKNAAVLDTRRLNPDRNLDPATGVPPTADQMGALTAALGDTGYGIAPTSRGATIFPFDPNATTKDVNKMLKDKRKELEGIYPSDIETSLNSSGYGPGVGKYTPEGFTASEPFSGQATKGLLKEASYLPQSAVQNLSESEFVRQAIREKMRRDAALEGARADIQNTRQFFAEADWAKAVDLIRKGMSPTAALAALGYSASSMAGEADR